MRTITLITLATLALSLAAPAAQAACYADYKAKKEKPLRLHYGVMEVDAEPCRMSNKIRQDVKARVSNGGWDLLQVQSVFEDDGLEARKKDAGKFYLRF